MITMGSTRRASVSPPLTRLYPPVSPPRAWAKMASPSSPYTIDGTPARFRMFVWRRRVNRVSRAYSSR